MSGNLWMFSDMMDDEDIEMLKQDFITYYQGGRLLWAWFEGLYPNGARGGSRI